MMKNDNEIKEDVRRIDETTIKNVCECLVGYNRELACYLARFVAALCDTDVDIMMSDMKNIDHVRARWLYWHAYRYMTDESYDSIAKKTSTVHPFSSTCVCQSVSKMAMMIGSDTIWTKRWRIVKRMVKIILNNTYDDDMPTSVKLKVIAPKGVTIDVKHEQP